MQSGKGPNRCPNPLCELGPGHWLGPFSFRAHWTEEDGLFIVSDAAAQFADLGYETYFRKRRRGGARLWKQVGPHLRDFGLLSRSVDCLTIRAPVGVLEASNVRASWNSLRTDKAASRPRF